MSEGAKSNEHVGCSKVVHSNQAIVSLVQMLVCSQALSYTTRTLSTDKLDLTYRILALSLVWVSIYARDGEVKTAVMKWLKEQSIKFYETGIHALIQRWNIAIERNGDNIEK